MVKEPSATVKAKLLELYPSLTSSLASALEARMKQMVEGLHKKLADRADKEANDIASILTELKKSIEAELKDPAYIQPSFSMTRSRNASSGTKMPCARGQRKSLKRSSERRKRFGRGLPTRRPARFPSP